MCTYMSHNTHHTYEYIPYTHVNMSIPHLCTTRNTLGGNAPTHTTHTSLHTSLHTHHYTHHYTHITTHTSLHTHHYSHTHTLHTHTHTHTLHTHTHLHTYMYTTLTHIHYTHTIPTCTAPSESVEGGSYLLRWPQV